MRAMQKRIEELTVKIDQKLKKLRSRAKDSALSEEERQKALDALERYETMLREQKKAANGGREG